MYMLLEGNGKIAKILRLIGIEQSNQRDTRLVGNEWYMVIQSQELNVRYNF